MSSVGGRHTRVFVLVAVTAAALMLATPGDGAASAVRMPPEGIFEGCPLDQAMQRCVNRLEVIAQAGFQVVVIPVSGASMSSLQTYATAADQLGVSVMWELGGPGWWQQPPDSTSMAGLFSAFASACGCDQNGPLLSYVIGWLSSLPATYGYYAVDDSMLAPGERPQIAGYVAQIKQRDPTHTVMIGSADQAQTDAYEPIADMIGAMIYPVSTDSLLPVAANQAIWDGVQQTALDTQRAANAADKQSAFILQAFTWGDNIDDGVMIGACSPNQSRWACYRRLRYPNAGEQLQLRNEVLVHAHPKLILWWSFPGTYGQASDDSQSIYPTGASAAARWSGLSAAIGAPPPGTAYQQRLRAAAARARCRHTAGSHQARCQRWR